MAKVIKDIGRCWQHLTAHNMPQLPKWRQVLEMSALYLFRGIGPGSYLQGKFWNPAIPFIDKWQHANRKEYEQMIDRWNARPYQKTSQHKVIEKAVLTLMKVPTPEFIGFFHPQSGITASGNPLKTLADFQSLCESLVEKKICLKPVEGFGGIGFKAFKIVATEQGILFEHPFTGETTTPEQWWQQTLENPDGYIIEHYLYQHPVISHIHPQSVNTLRIWVYRMPDRTEIACASLRVGRKGSLVDNTTSGGLYCPVDIATGKLKYGVFSNEPWVQLGAHPDTGSTIPDVQIPFWDECKKIAGQALLAFPHVHIAGVDVAISVNGPQMIELNVKADQIGPTRLNVPLKRLGKKLAQAHGTH